MLPEIQYAPSFKTRFRQYLLPGIIFQSVLIGGAYATGREIVEYGAQFGAGGIWSILVIGLGFSVLSILTFEFARINKAYDYRTFMRSLIGPLWPVFDVLFVVLVIVVIAVVGAASGRIVEDILGWNYWTGVTLMILIVGGLMAGGRTLIERFKTVGSVFLYSGFVLFSGLVIVNKSDNIAAVFAAGDTSYAGEQAVPFLLFTGLLYVGYNLANLHAVLFVLDAHTERKHSIGAGLVTGVLATIPFVLTYLAVMGHYPDADVIDAPVPWLVMLRDVAGPGILTLYAFVIFWTLVETSTGLIHAVVKRMEVHLEERALPPMTSLTEGLFAAGILVLAALLSRFGIIALVAQGYSLLAYGFLLLFALPLVTIGVWQIWKVMKE